MYAKYNIIEPKLLRLGVLVKLLLVFQRFQNVLTYFFTLNAYLLPFLRRRLVA